MCWLVLCQPDTARIVWKELGAVVEKMPSWAPDVRHLLNSWLMRRAQPLVYGVIPGLVVLGSVRQQTEGDRRQLPSLTSASSAPASRFLPSLLWWWTLTWNFEWRNLGIHLVYAPMCIHVWWFPGVHTYVNTCVMIPLCTHLYVYMCDDYPVYTCVTITRVQPMYIHVCDNCPVCTPMCIYVCDDYLVYSYV